MVGKLIPDFFPAIFGPKQDAPLDADAVREKFASLAAEVGDGRTPEDVADGFIQIAVANMAEAIKKISVQRGYDVTRYALNCFGGAGGQHACLVADALGMTTVLLHPLSGLLSAYGMGLAEVRAVRQKALDVPLDEHAPVKLRVLAAELEEACRAELAGQGVPVAETEVHVRAHVRYAGTDTTLPTAEGYPAQMRAEFEAQHKARFGFVDPSKSLVIEAVEVEAVGGGARFAEPASEAAEHKPKATRTTRFYSQGAWREAVVVKREAMAPGAVVAGPAIIVEPNQTIVVEHGWVARLTAKDHIVLTREIAAERRAAVGTKADPVMLEIFNNLFMSIAEQMGVALQNTAYSVNIKERLDFSCAVFDSQASLVANAPHMPVHLGSMDKSVETIIRQNPAIRPGDVFALNAPYNGGTHLPDITVCTPVFDDAGQEVIFWVASRGHHADVGGVAPGSMSPLATHIEEEGVYIDNFKLVDQGRFREEELNQLLTGAKYPVRNLTQNVADLKAQIAANEKGVSELRKVIKLFGIDVVQAYMRHVQDNAEESVRRVLDRLKDSDYLFEMDGGRHIRVRITVDREKRRARVDFTGTSPQQPDNFNAPMPVTRAATLYVFRVMVDDEIPMNAGCLKPIDIVVPPQSMLSPEYPAAVVAGNVEVSQSVTNALFGALGAMATSQGTMNNLTFGDATYQYYETICSGSPAGEGFEGTDGVHVHMTNSRLTDPRSSRRAFPWCWRISTSARARAARGSGRRRWHLAHHPLPQAHGLRHPLPASRDPPRGLAGGGDGEVGRTLIRRVDGRVETLKGSDQTVLEPGEAVIVIPPTAGGYGRA